MIPFTCYYFGCWDDCGHHLYCKFGLTVRESKLPDDFPCRLEALDQSFLPLKRDQTQGRATLAHLNGWTILAFWDRSVDSRFGSNSAYVMRGTHDLNEARRLAKEDFPNIWKRYTFEVTK